MNYKLFELKICVISIVSQMTLGKVYVVWPKGISWWSWRMQLGFPSSHSGFYLYYLSEWKSAYADLKWKNAEYKEPEVFSKLTNFVPHYLKKNCDPDGISIRHLYYHSAREDIRRYYKILKILGGSKYYDNYFWETYVTFFYNICSCLRGLSISQTCPDPCRKKDACVTEANVIKGSCRKVPDKYRILDLIDGEFKTLYGSLYKFKSECTCKQGYIWNTKSQTCDFFRVGCSMKRIGNRVCRNGGKCVPVPMEERQYDFQVLRCLCSPAWTGYLCTEPVNLCKHSHKLCGSFQCRRDETSVSKGYYCICTKGFQRSSEYEPRCVNIDECQSTPCQHGGKCLDLVPDPQNLQSLLYNCTCIHGFTGLNCEVAPKRAQWSQWESWSTCSKTCGIGRITRKRVCSEAGRCSGLSTQSTACILLGQSCDFVTESDQENKLKMGGIGWSADEDRIISDAFRWNEKLFSDNPSDTLHYLGKLENSITIILLLLIIPTVVIIIFNIILLKPHPWLMITVRSHIARQDWTREGFFKNQRHQLKKQHKKILKTIRFLKHKKEISKSMSFDTTQSSNVNTEM